MNLIRTILTLFVCGVCAVHGYLVVRVVSVGGDVPKPGHVDFEDGGMTIASVMEKAGMDLRQFKAENNGSGGDTRCPIRIVVFRKGEETIYDPCVDSVVMREPLLEPNDVIEVTDLRLHPEKIGACKKRIEKTLELGSIEIMDELLSLSKLQYEYDRWLGKAGENANGSAGYLKKEAARLVGEGKGRRIIDILEIKLGRLESDGLGPSHPTIKSTMDLIRIYRDPIAKE